MYLISYLLCNTPILFPSVVSPMSLYRSAYNIDSHLQWEAHCHSSYHSKELSCFKFITTIIICCFMDVKSLTHGTIVRLNLEYASIEWNSLTASDKNVIEAVWKRAAQWICARWNPPTYIFLGKIPC